MSRNKLKHTRQEDAIRDDAGNIVGAWNGRTILALHKAIDRALSVFDCLINLAELPHGDQIPPDIDGIVSKYECGIEVYACDQQGFCLVWNENDDDARIAHCNEIRCYLVEEFGFRLCQSINTKAA